MAAHFLALIRFFDHGEVVDRAFIRFIVEGAGRLQWRRNVKVHVQAFLLGGFGLEVNDESLIFGGRQKER